MKSLAQPPTGQPDIIQDDPSAEMRASCWIAGTFFIGFLGWAAFAPLDAGAYAHGQVEVAGNRQVVQHRDGGIVSALMVKEGDTVSAGQSLLSISAGDIRALERGLTGDYLNLVAERARLAAAVQGISAIAAPADFAGLSPEDRVIAADALKTQTRLLQSQLASAGAQKSVLRQQSLQVAAHIGGLSAEGQALDAQRGLVNDELQDMRRLALRGYGSENRIRDMQRQLASLQGDQSSRTADIASARQNISEVRVQALVVDRTRIEKADQQSRDVAQQLAEVQPKLIAARQQLARSMVRAPVAGRVVGLRVFTVGGVVGPGETLMEIVPQHGELVIQAHMSPDEIDDVRSGMRVKVRFPSLHDHSLPDVFGAISTISADAITDEKTEARYFTAEIRVPHDELTKLGSERGQTTVQAGMPAEVLVTLRRRSLLDYLLEPVMQLFWHTGREH